MTGKTVAIVLSKVKYGDNSFITNLYSLDYGRFAALIRIPKTSKGGIKPSLFFPLNIIETEVKLKNTRSIQSVIYCNRKQNLDNICNDIYKTGIAQFIAEILSKTIKEEEANPQLFNFLVGTITELNDAKENISDLHLYFLRDFAKISGFGITNNLCSEMPFFNLKEGMFIPMFTSESESLDVEESKIMSHFLESSYQQTSKFINFRLRKLLIENLLIYYKFHIPGFGEINSLKILQEVFND
jgi:DNA repair protein RecO (recombination protein O)